jgi:hypothetical protein
VQVSTVPTTLTRGDLTGKAAMDWFVARVMCALQHGAHDLVVQFLQTLILLMLRNEDNHEYKLHQVVMEYTPRILLVQEAFKEKKGKTKSQLRYGNVIVTLNRDRQQPVPEKEAVFRRIIQECIVVVANAGQMHLLSHVGSRPAHLVVDLHPRYEIEATKAVAENVMHLLQTNDNPASISVHRLRLCDLASVDTEAIRDIFREVKTE